MQQHPNSITTHYDWLCAGPQLLHQIYPPAIDSTAVDFSDGLRVTIPTKIREIRLRIQEIGRWSKKAYSQIAETTTPGTFDEWFWTYYIACHESETQIVERWLKYWLNLWQEIHPAQKPKVLPGKLDERDFELARQYDWDRLLPNLRTYGRMRSTKCPFHEERTPSFYIYPDGYYHCYGCSAHGNPIDFVMQKESLDFISAVKRLL